MLTILVFDARARCRYAKSKFSYRYVEWRNFYVLASLAHNMNRLQRASRAKKLQKIRAKSKCYRKICGIKMNECIKTANGYEKHRSVMLLCHTLLYSGSDCVPTAQMAKNDARNQQSQFIAGYCSRKMAILSHICRNVDVFDGMRYKK